MICARCDEPIKRDEPYETNDVERPTNPGVTFYFHKRLCKKPPTQTAPVGRGA